jgi:transposase
MSSTECFLEAHPTLKADGVALALKHMADRLQEQGFKKIICYLDQSSTHKTLMKYNLALLAPNISIEIRYLPPYSPKLNVVEFVIHRIRQAKLHHAPHTRVEIYKLSKMTSNNGYNNSHLIKPLFKIRAIT